MNRRSPTTSVCYQLYGTSVASERVLSYHVPFSSGTPSLSVVCSDEPFTFDAGWTRVGVPSSVGEQTSSSLYYHAGSTRHVVRFEEEIDFLLEADTITCHLGSPSLDYAVEVLLLGPVFSLWSELQGRPALHAAVGVVDGDGVGFLATNKGGKSSLAAALMQLGCPLLTDDVLMVHRVGEEIVGQPSYPQMRMWPDQAAHFLGADAVEALPLVVPHLSKRRIPIGTNGGFGDFCSTARPITTLFLPERRPDVSDVRAERLSPSEALIELVRYSFLAKAVDQLKLAPRRLPVLFALANQVRMYRLVYPEGVQHLSRVADAVVQIVRNG